MTAPFPRDQTSEKALAKRVVPHMTHFGYFFLGYFTGSPQITVQAVAAASGQANICIIVESDAAASALDMSGNASVRATDCSANSNSSSTKGLAAKGDARLQTELSCSVGGYAGAPRNYSPLPLTDCPRIGDPLAARAAAIDAAINSDSCAATKLDIKKANKTLSPGTYCGDTKISDGAQVFLKPGIYVINNGKLRVDKKSSIVGEDVGFVFVGDKAGLEFKNDSTVSLSAPTTGPLSGILMYAGEDPKRNGNSRSRAGMRKS